MSSSSTSPERPTSPRSRRPLVIGVLVTVAAIAVVLIGRTLVISHYEESRSYAAAASIPARNGLFVLPGWAPDDARDLTIHVQTQGKGRSLELTTASTTMPAGCLATPRPDVDPIPGLDDNPGGDGYRCGEWFVVRDGHRLAAWTAYDQ